jgi:hypothetical protein
MSHMVCDEVALNLRSAHGFDGLLNHLGEAGSNPVRDHGVLVLRFERHSQTVTYPTLIDFHRYWTEVLEKLDDQRHNVTFVREKRDVNELDLKWLKDIQMKDPLAEISEQDKSTVSHFTFLSISLPVSLPVRLSFSLSICLPHCLNEGVPLYLSA